MTVYQTPIHGAYNSSCYRYIVGRLTGIGNNEQGLPPSILMFNQLLLQNWNILWICNTLSVLHLYLFMKTATAGAWYIHIYTILHWKMIIIRYLVYTHKLTMTLGKPLSLPQGTACREMVRSLRAYTRQCQDISLFPLKMFVFPFYPLLYCAYSHLLVSNNIWAPLPLAFWMWKNGEWWASDRANKTSPPDWSESVYYHPLLSSAV